MTQCDTGNGAQPLHNREELEMSILREVSGAIGGALDIEKVFESTMDILARELHMRRGTLVLRDGITDELKIVAAHGLSREEKDKGRYKLGEGVTGGVVQTGRPVAVHDIRRHPGFLNRTGARRSGAQQQPIAFVCVPIRVDEDVVGAISIDRSLNDEATLIKDQRLLQIIAGLLGQAIKINRLVATERRQLQAENQRLRKDLQLRHRFGNIVAASGMMQDVLDTAVTVAKSKATVLLRGETGTGKELIASLIHYNSERADGPFIKVNCGALAENLLESELFGHERGAFTGAVEQRMGRFELADGGTIFLDEIGTVGALLQVKLLRVLQEKEFERLGGSKTLRSDVRVVAATNADLETEVKNGRFREDLYYRLNVIPVYIPPLRSRRDDIPFLVDFFLDKYNKEYGKNVCNLARDVLDALVEFPWPGNVRELESCLERAVVLCTGDTITPDLLPVSIRSSMAGPTCGVGAAPAHAPPAMEQPDESDAAERFIQGLIAGQPRDNVYDRVMTRVEKILLESVLQHHDRIQIRAAEQLGMSRNTLRKKIKDLHIPL